MVLTNLQQCSLTVAESPRLIVGSGKVQKDLSVVKVVKFLQTILVLEVMKIKYDTSCNFLTFTTETLLSFTAIPTMRSGLINYG